MAGTMEERDTGNPPVINGRLTSITEYSPLLVCLGDPAKFPDSRTTQSVSGRYPDEDRSSL